MNNPIFTVNGKRLGELGLGIKRKKSSGMGTMSSKLKAVLKDRKRITKRIKKIKATPFANPRRLKAEIRNLKKIDRIAKNPESYDVYEQAKIREEIRANRTIASSIQTAKNVERSRAKARENIKTAHIIQASTPFEVLDRKWIARDAGYARMAKKASFSFRRRLWEASGRKTDYWKSQVNTKFIADKWEQTRKQVLRSQKYLDRISARKTPILPPSLLKMYGEAGSRVAAAHPEYTPQQIAAAVRSQVIRRAVGTGGPLPPPIPIGQPRNPTTDQVTNAALNIKADVNEKIDAKSDILKYLLPVAAAGLFIMGGGM